MSRSRMVARNVAATIINQLLSWVITFYVTLKLPAYIGASGLGDFTIANSVGAICGLIVTLGTSTVLIREIARDHNRTRDLIPAALALRMPLGLAALAVAFALAVILHYTHFVTVLILLAVCCMIFSQINDVFASALIGLEQLPRQNRRCLLKSSFRQD